MFPNQTINFRCEMLWSPNVMYGTSGQSFSYFPFFLSLCSFSFLRNISVLYSKIKTDKNKDKFNIRNIGKYLIDPLKGAAPLTEVIG